MASKRLLLYATDTYKLSSLLIRRVLLTKPATLAACREKTRQLLLDQSGPESVNQTAIKLLACDRELNLIHYYGVGEYAKRWWASQSWSSLSMFSKWSTIGDRSNQLVESTRALGEKADKGNGARVAFMITSSQRRDLSMNLGYNLQDIRSFKPIEALLLLEHGVKKEAGDFRTKLKQLVEEKERSMKMKLHTQPQRQSKIISDEDLASECEDGPTTTIPVQKSTITPEEAEQIHAKPDVALALLSVDKKSNDQQYETIHKGEKIVDDSVSTAKSIGVNEMATDFTTESTNDQTSASSGSGSPHHPGANPGTINSITPRESDKLHMKPDVATAILASEQRNEPHGEDQPLFLEDQEEVSNDDRPCWYEVVKGVTTKPTTTISTAHESRNLSQGSDATNKEQVIALFPTKKEALECVRIKQSLRRGEGGIFFVRRRWNV